MSYSCCLCLFMYSVVQHVLTVGTTYNSLARGFIPRFFGGVRVTHRFVFCVVLWDFCFVSVGFVLYYLVCPLFPAYLYCQFLIAPFVFSNDYLRQSFFLKKTTIKSH